MQMLYAEIIRRELMGSEIVKKKLIKSIFPRNVLTLIPMVNYFHRQEQKKSQITLGLGDTMAC